MAKDHIRYDLLVQDAFRDLFRRVLSDTAVHGLPGEHHFYITFRTDAAGVKMSERLRAQYPEQMTIVLQHEFWELKVDETGFDVGLSFRQVPEKLHVPFAAVTAFFDPSVNFGAEFTVEDDNAANDPRRDAGPETTSANADAPAAARPAPRPSSGDEPIEPAASRAEGASQTSTHDAATESPKVVSIDAFRKKP